MLNPAHGNIKHAGACCKDGHLHAIAKRDGVGRVLFRRTRIPSSWCWLLSFGIARWRPEYFGMGGGGGASQ